MTEHLHPHQLTDAKLIREFVLAGNCRVTLVSKRTATRFTYSVRQPDDLAEGAAPVWFVGVLTGSDNESSYSYMGIVRDDKFSHTGKSKVGADAASAKAWAWFWNKCMQHGKVPDELEVWHEGRCGKCNRVLTVPESIERGIGPECWKRMAA